MPWAQEGTNAHQPSLEEACFRVKHGAAPPRASRRASVSAPAPTAGNQPSSSPGTELGPVAGAHGVGPTITAQRRPDRSTAV
jgi:hypothetical protein